MGFFKKTLFAIGSIVLLFSLSFLPCDLGRFSFHFAKIEASAQTNVVMASLIALFFILSCFSVFWKFLSRIFKTNEDQKEKESMIALINLVFLETPDDLEDLSKYKVIEKHKVLKEAISYALYEKFKKYPAIIESSKNRNRELDILVIHQIRLKIEASLATKEITKAQFLIEKILTKYPSHVPLFQKQILEIARTNKLTFDPRKFKYNLPKGFIDEYQAISILKDYQSSRDISILEKGNKNYPGNVTIALELIKNKPTLDDKKIIAIVKKGFQEKPDRRYAEAFSSLQKKDTLLETAVQLTKNSSSNDLEKMWFLAIVAAQLNHTARAAELCLNILNNYPEEKTQLETFFLVNHSKLSNNVELLQSIKEAVKK